MAAGYRRLIDAWEVRHERSPVAQPPARRRGPRPPRDARERRLGPCRLRAVAVAPGQSVAQATGEREACIVIVGGKADITAGGQSWPASATGQPVRGRQPVSVTCPGTSGSM